jgi:hypothetical protein
VKTLLVSMVTLALACGGLAAKALAQKGMGDRTGVARQLVKPAIVTISGKVVEIRTGPCEKTTGRSPIGTHILLKSPSGEQFNLHLGPQAAVANIVARLIVGEQVTAKAFRTEKMPQSHYTAQSLTVGETTEVLRDAGLRPVWAGPQRGAIPARKPQAQQESPAVERTTAQTNESVSTSLAGPRRGRCGGGPPWAGGRGWGGGPGWAGGGAPGGRGADDAFQADRAAFHFLLDSGRN